MIKNKKDGVKPSFLSLYFLSLYFKVSQQKMLLSHRYRQYADRQ